MENPYVEEILKDAEELYQDAVRELERGKIRDAAEKAWKEGISLFLLLPLLALLGSQLFWDR